MSEKQDEERPDQQPVKRRPGRPPTYIFSKPDSELSENERRLKGSVIKRRMRQNRSYHRKKQLKELAKQAARPPPHNACQPTSQAPPIAHPGVRPPNLPLTAPLSISSKSSPSLRISLPPLASHPTRPLMTSAESAFRPISYLPDHSTTPAYQTNPASHTNSVFSTVADTPSMSTEEILATIEKTLESAPDSKKYPASRAALPRVEGAILHTPVSGPQIRGSNSGAGPFLSAVAGRPSAASGKHESLGFDDSDEAQLLADILTVGGNERTNSVAEEPRSAGVRRFLRQDLDHRLAALPRGVMEGLKHLILFAGSFDANAALKVMGVEPHAEMARNAEILQPLVDVNFIRKLPSARFELNDITKSLVSNESCDGASAARQRFVLHYSEKLQQLEMTSLYCDAQERLGAMRAYDVERQNVDVALHMCRDMRDMHLLTTFLANGATVMRYSVPAKQRLEIYRPVMREIRASPHQQLCTPVAEARILLAMGEAYFDVFLFEKAEFTLRKAVAMMADNRNTAFPLSFSVLALLLLAELRMSQREFEEATKLLVQALKTLDEGRFERSTFQVCITLNLASISIAKGDTDGGMHSVRRALTLLTDLGFKDMPIYADALGTLGSVHMRRREYSEALTYFASGQRLMQDWIRQEGWGQAPLQHCTHLDIFLDEAIGKAKMKLEKHEEAGELFARVRQQREERGLPGRGFAAWECQAGRDSSCRMYTRHLY